MKVVLERYHGLSNDYVVFDPNKNELELTPGNVKMICDRNAGLGADGVLEGPVIKEDGMHVKEWKRCPYFCKIFKRCRLYPKEEFQIIYQIWGGSSYIFK